MRTLRADREIFGGLPSQEIYFKIPEPIHHARCMEKAINCFKIQKNEEIFIISICTFIIRVYTKAWFNAPIASNVPIRGYMFRKYLIKYTFFDKTTSKIAKKINYRIYHRKL